MPNTLPFNRVEILHCLGCGLPVHYILLLPATFYLLNAAMGIMHKKFGPICNIMPCKYTPDKRLGTLCMKLYWLTLPSLHIKACWDKDQYSLSLVVLEAGEKWVNLDLFKEFELRIVLCLCCFQWRYFELLAGNYNVSHNFAILSLTSLLPDWKKSSWRYIVFKTFPVLCSFTMQHLELELNIPMWPCNTIFW